MDIKTMAKSKRSHTRHHQPRKPHTPSSSSSSSDPKLLNNKQAIQKRAVTQLPTNWDRYQDNDELSILSDSDDLGKLASSNSNAEPDLVMPKSKGSDFGYLIAQAKDSKSRYAPSFDDTLPDFYQGLGPMLAVKGESMHSWDGADNFLGDDEGPANPEAPFFNLDLQCLAEQLAKVDLAKRLFIEEDLLPPELSSPELNEKDNREESFVKSEKQKKAAGTETFDDLLSLYVEAEQEAEAQNNGKTGDVSSSSVVRSANPEPGLSSADVTEASVISNIPDKDIPVSSGFEAAAAEAELDMLLNSFSEVQSLDSPAPQFEVPSVMKQSNTLLPSLKGNPFTHDSRSQHALGISTAAFPSSLDDALDNLLEETSRQNYKDGLSQSAPVHVTSVDPPPSSYIVTKSKSNVAEDFDSWFDNL